MADNSVQKAAFILAAQKDKEQKRIEERAKELQRIEQIQDQQFRQEQELKVARLAEDTERKKAALEKEEQDRYASAIKHLRPKSEHDGPRPPPGAENTKAAWLESERAKKWAQIKKEFEPQHQELDKGHAQSIQSIKSATAQQLEQEKERERAAKKEQKMSWFQRNAASATREPASRDWSRARDRDSGRER